MQTHSVDTHTVHRGRQRWNQKEATRVNVCVSVFEDVEQWLSSEDSESTELISLKWAKNVILASGNTISTS